MGVIVTKRRLSSHEIKKGSHSHFYLFVSSICVFSCSVYLNLYNTYFFSLSQLRDRIEVGQSHSDVKLMFDDYRLEHQGDSHLRFYGGYTDRLLTGFVPPPRKKKVLSIRHRSFAGDADLQVVFDESDKVEQVLFVGD